MSWRFGGVRVQKMGRPLAVVAGSVVVGDVVEVRR
jgi:hypothetical protein